jgi:hypothetical protein
MKLAPDVVFASVDEMGVFVDFKSNDYYELDAVNADRLTSRFGIGRPEKTNSKEQ